MTTISSLSEDEARELWAGGQPGREEYFFSTVAATGTVWAWDFETGLLEIDDQDNALVPLWPHPRLAVMAAEAMGFEDAEPAVPVDVDVLLGEVFERFHREGHEIAVLPTDGTFTTILSLERFRVNVFEARLQAAGLTDQAARARREEFYADRVRRADRRLGLLAEDRHVLVEHLRECLASAACEHRITFPATRDWIEARGLSWDLLSRSAVKVLGSCDCEILDHLRRNPGQTATRPARTTES
ncbi:DUF2695 domain-containing protein [Umezawaea tangerina]|uniref:Uncharacterized protein DUF2695 n=1 Tax=Umezawaea tangerina TaxID=84725 RepID=A0A2T0T7L3_9PSEU|nr:DUF2695 domain-containing protein [Umezawaea tangerina]PRY41666.1 uncharacterized protein DUF2695 [Umezawaea tangerina]